MDRDSKLLIWLAAIVLALAMIGIIVFTTMWIFRIGDGLTGQTKRSASTQQTLAGGRSTADRPECAGCTGTAGRKWLLPWLPGLSVPAGRPPQHHRSGPPRPVRLQSRLFSPACSVTDASRSPVEKTSRLYNPEYLLFLRFSVY